jgi:hypothetical protein
VGRAALFRPVLKGTSPAQSRRLPDGLSKIRISAEANR